MSRSDRDWPAPRAGRYVLLYLILGAVLLPFFRHQINSDGLSYLSIAMRYAAGDLAGAVNGYWGPLLSWLMVPLIALGIEPLLAGKIVSLGLGAAAAAGLVRLARFMPLTEKLRWITLLSLLPFLATASLRALFPDLLVVALTLHYLAFVFADGYEDRLRNGLWCGLLGGLLYYAKAYGFYVFLLHFAVMGLLRLLRADDGRRRLALVRNHALGLAVFAVLAGAWIGVLSARYGEPTISTTGVFNHALAGPASRGQPMHYLGFLPPQDERAFSAWETPTTIPIADWSLRDPGGLRHQLGLLKDNLKLLGRDITAYSRLMALILVGSLLLCVQPLRRLLRDGPTLYPLVTVAVFPAGYLLMLLEVRYVWICPLLITLMGARLLGMFMESGLGTRPRRIAAIALFVVSVIIYPVKLIVQGVGQGERVRAVAATLADLGLERGARTASNREWADSLYLAYHLDSRYYGERGDLTDEQVAAALQEHRVRYYLVWDPEPAAAAPREGWTEITAGRVPRLAVYEAPRESVGQ